jgi:hydroxyethylthiazole kinase-like uncharacterized protein yjeF
MGIDLELLTPKEMAMADARAADLGPLDSYGLMVNAGQSVTACLLNRYPAATGFDILCGPGNNGGDGYVIARLLAKAGVSVSVYADGAPRAGTDAERAAKDCPLTATPVGNFRPTEGTVVVDALYGAGLTRPLAGEAKAAAEACNEMGVTVVAVDLPSGLSGETGQPLGASFRADLTITFFRLKPGHLLEPGRDLCGETILADIGIPNAVLETIEPNTFRNKPALWLEKLPRPQRGQHKYSRGHAAVFSGGPSSTGAARLCAIAAARGGAGATTIWSPASAITTNAAHLTSIMLRKLDDAADLREAFAEREPAAIVLGPGYGLRRPIREMVLAVLAQSTMGTLVLDADAITGFRDEPETLFDAIKRSRREVVLTPHEGEFARIFPDITDASKLTRARKAGEQAGAVIVLKGPDTVVAAPDGRAAINENGSPWLATAGSGDVLAGIIAGLAAQKMPLWEASCAAVWLHAEAASRFGPGLIADDLPGLLPPLLRELL